MSMSLKKEREVIFRAVRDSIAKEIEKTNSHYLTYSRKTVSDNACIIANRRGVNCTSAPHLQDILIEALDKKQKEGMIE